MINEAMTAIANCLDRARIPYMIIGGQAVLQYGRLRTTEVIDVTVDISIENWSNVQAALEGEFKITASNSKQFVEPTGVLPAVHEKSGVRVDFIFGQTGFETEAIRRTRSVDIEEVKVRFISPEDLIIQKLFAGRSVDIADATSVYRNQKEKLDGYRMARVLGELDEVLSQNVCVERWNQLQKET